MRPLYAALAILGWLLPWTFLVSFLRQNGLDVGLLVSQLFANDISSFFAADLLISCLVFWVWLFREAREQAIARPWLYLVATLMVGLSFAFPLFLYVREGYRERQTLAGSTRLGAERAAR